MIPIIKTYILVTPFHGEQRYGYDSKLQPPHLLKLERVAGIGERVEQSNYFPEKAVSEGRLLDAQHFN